MDNVSINRRFLETGDEVAFEQVFNNYYKIVYDAANKVVRNREDADEIANDTFMRAFNKREEIREPKKLLVWLRTTAGNLAIDKIRKSRQQAKYLSVELLGDLSVRERDLRFASILVETDAEQTQANKELVNQLLRLLPDKDRETVELTLDGLTPKEIVKAIDSTPGAVQKRWERLIGWLKPVGIHLEVLVNCLPGERDRQIMGRYLDNQSLSVIAKAMGISDSTIERTVKRVVAEWKKAAKQNSMDPVSAMVNNRK